jgi:hypothetical protein
MTARIVRRLIPWTGAMSALRYSCTFLAADWRY